MKRFFCLFGLLLLVCSLALAQAPEVKFVADTLVVQADRSYEADPDLATMTFQIFSQDKDIKPAYAAATQSMQRIVDLAGQNGLKKEDVTTGVLTVAPVYEGDRKKRARSYYCREMLYSASATSRGLGRFWMDRLKMASQIFVH
jgi:uncharacterized protein YggE